jgi:hypothetical protein
MLEAWVEPGHLMLVSSSPICVPSVMCWRMLMVRQPLLIPAPPPQPVRSPVHHRLCLLHIARLTNYCGCPHDPNTELFRLRLQRKLLKHALGRESQPWPQPRRRAVLVADRRGAISRVPTHGHALRRPSSPPDASGGRQRTRRPSCRRGANRNTQYLSPGRLVKHVGANYQACSDCQRAPLYCAPVMSGACGRIVQAISSQVLDKRARKSYASLAEVNGAYLG